MKKFIVLSLISLFFCTNFQTVSAVYGYSNYKRDIKNNQKRMDDLNLQIYLKDLIDSEKENNRKYNFTSLARELNINERTLRNKKANNTFKKDECIYIALRFGLSVGELNRLLVQNNCDRLSALGRDGAIMNCLKCKYNYQDSNKFLKEHGWEPLPYFGTSGKNDVSE